MRLRSKAAAQARQKLGQIARALLGGHCRDIHHPLLHLPELMCWPFLYAGERRAQLVQAGGFCRPELNDTCDWIMLLCYITMPGETGCSVCMEIHHQLQAAIG